jgi:hypothetical protein
MISVFTMYNDGVKNNVRRVAKSKPYAIAITTGTIIWEDPPIP